MRGGIQRVVPLSLHLFLLWIMRPSQSHILVCGGVPWLARRIGTMIISRPCLLRSQTIILQMSQVYFLTRLILANALKDLALLGGLVADFLLILRWRHLTIDPVSKGTERIDGPAAGRAATLVRVANKSGIVVLTLLNKPGQWISLYLRLPSQLLLIVVLVLC